MKISLEWLAQYLPGPLEANAAAEALTHAGLPVEIIEQFGDDKVIDVEVTSNRPDCLSYIGIAREFPPCSPASSRTSPPRCAKAPAAPRPSRA